MRWVILICAIDAILRFFGVADPQELSEYEYERMEHYLEHPVKINHLSMSRLMSSGLLSQYQSASLVEYRSEHGDVLSFAELAAVDGFGVEFVEILSPFVSLESARLPGHRSPEKFLFSHELDAKTGYKTSSGLSYGIKYRLEAGESLSFGVGYSGAVSANLAWQPVRGALSTLIVGDFNARFGQGLALWNGMTMSGFSSTQSLRRRSYGVSPAWSYKGSAALTGLASSFVFGHLCVNAGLALPNFKQNLFSKGSSSGPAPVSLLPFASVSWYGRKIQMSFTNYVDYLPCVGLNDFKSAFETNLSLRKTFLFSEVSVDWKSLSPAFLAGLSFRACESLMLAALLRCYPPSYSAEYSGAPRSYSGCSNEIGATVAGDFSQKRHKGNFSADVAYSPAERAGTGGLPSIQMKFLLDYDFVVSETLVLSARLSERVRSYGHISRTDFRTDLSYVLRRWQFKGRANILKCDGLGALTYVEGGYNDGKLSVWLRQGVFFIDDWDDRIYVYERDAPGNFSVPAYYGRGLWTALTMGWKALKCMKIYMRASFVGYPFMDGANKKPGVAELKVSCAMDF